MEGRRRGGIPTGVLHGLHEGAGLGLDPVDLMGGGVGRQPEGGTQPGDRVADATPHLGGAKDRQHEVDPALPSGGVAEDVQAVADLGVLDLAQPAVDVQQEVVELFIVGALVQTEVAVHLGGAHERPDLPADRGQLRRIHGGDVGVLVHQEFELGDVAIAFGARHRRDQVVHDEGVGAPLRLSALAGIVHQERVDQRQAAQGGVRAAGRGRCRILAGQPFQGAVLAEVDNGVRAEAVFQPAVGGQVVVGGRQVGVVVDRDRVLPEAARRLDQDDDVARSQRRQHEFARVVDEQGAGRGPPGVDHGLAQVGGQVGGPFQVLLGGDLGVRVGELRGGQPLFVLAARRDERVDEGVTCGGVVFGCPGGVGVKDVGDRVVLAQVVALGDEAAQQPDRRHRGVQPDRVADAGVLGRVGRQHEREPLLGVVDVAQLGVVGGDSRDAQRPLRVGDVVG